MTREEIIDLWSKANGWNVKEFNITITELERFAALVAKHTLANIDPSSFMSWQEGYAAGVAAEREACADKTGEFARKWWSIHCASNKHMETTRKAHDDFCALQAAIRARGNT